MPSYKFTSYFEDEVLRKRPYLTKEMCIQVVQTPERFEQQDLDRCRFWAKVPSLGDRYLRVVTLGDKISIHNAFLDSRFKP